MASIKKMENCKLCGKESELRKSHILPEFVYLNIYDESPRRFQEIKSENGKGKSTFHQKGIREKLFCGKCESLLSRFEKTADETIFGKNSRSKAILRAKIKDEEKELYLFKYAHIPYADFKLFLDSILFRIIISNSFITESYENHVTEKLRMSILNEEPLNSDEFPCSIHMFLKSEGIPFRKFFFYPIDTNLEDPRSISITVDGLSFTFYIENFRNLPPEQFLQENGDLNIYASLIQNHPEFLETLGEAMKFIK